jgi:hypothetical protein
LRTFAATAWTFAWNLRASTAGCVGRINMRVWRSVNADGSAATSLLALTAGATVTLSTTADVNSSISWSPGALTLNNEYLFFQVEWQETTAGSVNGDNVFFRAGTAAITTPDFQASVTGTLNVAQAAQTLSSAGKVAVNGVLALTELSDTLAATGKVLVNGALALTETNDTISASGTVADPAITGALNITQAAQTVTAAGGPIVGATLGLTQANQIIAASGAVSLAGVLNVIQASQILVGAASVAVKGDLAQAQAAQTLSATGYVTPPAVSSVQARVMVMA